jgi:hypothetical protein
MPAAAIVGGAVIGGATSLIGSSKAASAAKDASAASIAEQRRQFDLVRGDTAQARQVGSSALGKLSRLYGLGDSTPAPAPVAYSPGQFGLQGGSGFLPGMAIPRQPVTIDQGTGSITPQSSTPDMSVFFQSPDYQFNLGEGQRAIDNSLAARGGALSGAGVKAGVRYASGMASREFGSFYDRLANLAGIGQTGVAQSAAAGGNAANNISNTYQNAGAQRGSAYLMGAQGVNNAVQGGIGNALLNRYLGG